MASVIRCDLDHVHAASNDHFCTVPMIPRRRFTEQPHSDRMNIVMKYPSRVAENLIVASGCRRGNTHLGFDGLTIARPEGNMLKNCPPRDTVRPNRSETSGASGQARGDCHGWTCRPERPSHAAYRLRFEVDNRKSQNSMQHSSRPGYISLPDPPCHDRDVAISRNICPKNPTCQIISIDLLFGRTRQQSAHLSTSVDSCESVRYKIGDHRRIYSTGLDQP